MEAQTQSNLVTQRQIRDIRVHMRWLEAQTYELINSK